MFNVFGNDPKLPKRRRPAGVDIKPGKLGLDYTNLAENWHADNPFLTAFSNVLFAQFPAGERFLIQSARLFRDQITDLELKKDVAGFIGQEAHHANEHEAMNQMLKASGVPVDKVEKQTEWLLDKICSLLSEKDQMAATAALEHFTAMLGSLFLENDKLADEVHDSVLALLVWHAIEETEHKAVAFDLYQHTIGNYPRLMLAYLWTSSLLVLVTAQYQLQVMAADGSIFRPRPMLKGLNWMFGFGKGQGHFRRLLPEYLAFFNPGYHPWDKDNSAAIVRWKKVLGELQTANIQSGLARNLSVVR